MIVELRELSHLHPGLFIAQSKRKTKNIFWSFVAMRSSWLFTFTLGIGNPLAEARLAAARCRGVQLRKRIEISLSTVFTAASGAEPSGISLSTERLDRLNSESAGGNWDKVRRHSKFDRNRHPITSAHGALRETAIRRQ